MRAGSLSSDSTSIEKYKNLGAGYEGSALAPLNKKIIKLEFEYKKLVNEIIYDLYDEFKYGEALGLINKVVYKNVKKLVSENKRVNRKRGINDFVIPSI